MADMIVRVAGSVDLDGQVYIFGTCYGPGTGEANWDVTISYKTLAAGMNDAIREAAIAALGVKGFVVGALDSKTMHGGMLSL